MASTLRDIMFDCADQRAVARFWTEVLNYRVRPLPPDAPADEPVVIFPLAGKGPHIWFNRVPEPKVVKNRVHNDIDMDGPEEMDRLRRLGARPLREIRGEEGELWWTIMADIEGNEFCAFPPRP